jgi:hypothetical protein
VYLGAIIVFGAMSTIVVQTDHSNAIDLFQPARMVLEAEPGAVLHLEIGLLAVESLCARSGQLMI